MVDIYPGFIELDRDNTNDILLLTFYTLISLSKISLDKLTQEESQEWENLLYLMMKNVLSLK